MWTTRRLVEWTKPSGSAQFQCNWHINILIFHRILLIVEHKFWNFLYLSLMPRVGITPKCGSILSMINCSWNEFTNTNNKSKWLWQANGRLIRRMRIRISTTLEYFRRFLKTCFCTNYSDSSGYIRSLIQMISGWQARGDVQDADDVSKAQKQTREGKGKDFWLFEARF